MILALEIAAVTLVAALLLRAPAVKPIPQEIREPKKITRK